MGKAVTPTADDEPLGRKKPKAETTAAKHPWQRKKGMNKKLSKIYSNSILLGKFDFNPEEFLDKSILFDLKKTNEQRTNIWCHIGKNTQ